MNDEHKRSTPGERVLLLAEVLARVGDAFRAGGIHPYYVILPGEAPGEHHVAVCVDAYAAAVCLHGARAAGGGASPPDDTAA